MVLWLFLNVCVNGPFISLNVNEWGHLSICTCRVHGLLYLRCQGPLFLFLLDYVLPFFGTRVARWVKCDMMGLKEKTATLLCCCHYYFDKLSSFCLSHSWTVRNKSWVMSHETVMLVLCVDYDNCYKCSNISVSLYSTCNIHSVRQLFKHHFLHREEIELSIIQQPRLCIKNTDEWVATGFCSTACWWHQLILLSTLIVPLYSSPSLPSSVCVYVSLPLTLLLHSVELYHSGVHERLSLDSSSPLSCAPHPRPNARPPPGL